MNINEAENNVLSVLLTTPEKQSYILAKCKEEFFTDMLNRKVFKYAKDLFSKGLDIDNVSIFESSAQNKQIGERVVLLITETLANSISTKTYCSMLAQNYIDRLVKNAKTAEEFEKIEGIKQKILDFDSEKIKHIASGVEHFKVDYEEKSKKLFLTGYKDLDDCIGSIQGGDYIALGGSTGTGKTTFALNLAKSICAQGAHVLYCSLEMPLKQLQNRFASLTAGLNASKFRSIGFTKEELDKYQNALNDLKEWNLYTICDYNMTIDKLRIYAQEQKKIGLDFLIVDYLGLLNGFDTKSLYEKMTILSRKIKLLATELDIPVLVLVQLNRDSKNRKDKDKRPLLSDIRESGAIEQDADMVLFTYRPCLDYENKTESERHKKEFEIIIAKNRHGESNKICQLEFNLETQEILNKSVPNIHYKNYTD